MISVGNLYWVLYENLLKPAGLDCWYYFPWGTKNNLSRTGEFRPWPPKHEHHVLFHFDQEPIHNDNFGWHYDSLGSTWSTKLVRILANSEKSEIKRQICRSRGMLDWYFFYHGFAALDWFSDARYIDQNMAFSKVYSSFNHLVTGHKSYRMALTARLFDLGLQHHGNISFYGSADDCEAELSSSASRLSDKSKSLIDKNLRTSLSLPIQVDGPPTGDSSAHFGHREYKLWQQSFFHVVNESVFYDAKLHLTEKIFKPIVAMRPFVLSASPHNLAYLKQYGFQTFSDWIDESYDSESDSDTRLDMISTEIAKLCNMNHSQLHKMYLAMQPVLQHNRQHFFNGFREIIVEELVDNFETCIRIWNNGRIDSRQRPVHADYASIKKILLR